MTIGPDAWTAWEGISLLCSYPGETAISGGDTQVAKWSAYLTASSAPWPSQTPKSWPSARASWHNFGRERQSRVFAGAGRLRLGAGRLRARGPRGELPAKRGRRLGRAGELQLAPGRSARARERRARASVGAARGRDWFSGSDSSQGHGAGCDVHLRQNARRRAATAR